MDDPKILTVTALNKRVRKLLDRELAPLWVTGEISNLKLHQSGHVYLSLKDEDSQVRAVMFSAADKARALGLANGMEVEVFGRVSLYERQGAYQIYIDEIRPGGVGRLQREFDRLKRKLQAEGLFDRERKRAIPKLPQCIGLITSTNGAAMRDFFNVVNRRYPGLHVRIINARMQGDDSALQVVRALRYLNRTQACDVVVVTRGGGSMEDLWCFNHERLVREVAASDIPVICAIGHETDFTLAEFAADLRAPTPSAAAELVVGRRAEYRDRLQTTSRRLVSSLDLLAGALERRLEQAGHDLYLTLTQRLTGAQQRLEAVAGHYMLQRPEFILQPLQQRLGDASEALPRAYEAAFDRAQERLCQAERQLHLLGPRNVLGRGYAILMHEGRQTAVRRPADVAAGDQLKALLAEGELPLTVKDDPA